MTTITATSCPCGKPIINATPFHGSDSYVVWSCECGEYFGYGERRSDGSVVRYEMASEGAEL